MGRRPLGAKQVETLEGSAPSKARLAVILETIAGERTVAEACAELGIGESQFHALRRQALQNALTALEPKPRGRPKAEPTAEQVRISELEERLAEALDEIEIERIRAELAAVMPHVLKDRAPAFTREEDFDPGPPAAPPKTEPLAAGEAQKKGTPLTPEEKRRARRRKKSARKSQAKARRRNRR